MRTWSSSHIFDHPWETVTVAVSRKYPNPLNPAVVSTDVIDRQVVSGVLHSHKLVTSNWCFPTWTHALLGSSTTCYGSERSEINLAEKEMLVKTRNVSYLKYITVSETVKYTPDPEDHNRTLLTQQAIVSIRGVPFSNYLEDVLTSKIAQNAQKGRQAIEWVIDGLSSDLKNAVLSAIKSADGMLRHTRRQIDDITVKTKKSMDDLQSAAKWTLHGIQQLHVPPSPQ